MEVCVRMVHYLALVVALGSQAWWYVVWQPVYGTSDDEVSSRLWRRLRISVLLASGLCILAGLADAVRAAAQVVPVQDFGALWFFLTRSRYGQMALLKALCLPVSIRGFLHARPRGRATADIVLGSLVTMLALSLTSHAATQPGVIPLLSDLSHVCGAVLWGGGLIAWLHLPWRHLMHDPQHHLVRLLRLIERFSLLAFAAVVMLATSGVIAAFLHTYGLPAMTQTPYGRAVAGKIVLFAAALGLASYHLLVLRPACQRQTRRFDMERAVQLIRTFVRLVRLEALGVAGAVLLAGLLATLPPAARPGTIHATTWEQSLGAWHFRLAMDPLDAPGHVQLGVALRPVAGDVVPDNTEVFLAMGMPDHAMSNSRQRLVPLGHGAYTGTGVVSMAGRWHIAVTVQPAQGVAQSTAVDFEAVTGSRERDRQRRLEPAALLASPVHTISALLGVLLGVLALLMAWGAYVGRLPQWMLPGAVSMLACGGYFFFSIVLVDAYPTAYEPNPVVATPDALDAGQELFQNHCVTCHGLDGRGHGPAAIGLVLPPADVTAPHLDDHSDGELFWWLTHGIPGTAMPAWEDALSPQQRWQLVHYIRALRRQARDAGRTSS